MTSTAILMEYLRTHHSSVYEDALLARTSKPERFYTMLRIWEEQFSRDKPAFEIDPLESGEFVQNLNVDLSQSGLRYIDGFFSKKELRTAAEKILEKKQKLIFFVSNHQVLEGKIVNEVNPYKQKLTVATHACVYSKGVPLNRIFYFHEKCDTRTWHVQEKVSGEFWMYQFEANHRQYIILSESRLPLENFTVEGTVFELEDETPIGIKRALKTRLPILFVYKTHTKKIIHQNHNSLLKSLTSRDFSHEGYFNWLFSKDGQTFNHPSYFQYLVSSFLLSAKQKGYPLHLLMIARQGTGKSTLEETVFSKFKENVDIVEGCGSTIKVLIPSFKGNLPEPGVLLKANRLCVIDEFLRILMRVKKEDREAQLSALNPLLEHRKGRRYGSGNGSIVANPSAKVLAVTNPVWGTSRMDLLADHIDNSFLSRILIWYQDDEHIKWVESEKGLCKAKYIFSTDEWLALFDYCQTFVSQFDRVKVLQIFDEGLTLLGQDTIDNVLQKVRDIYTARYRHHILCLMDGIVKTRCVCTNDASFKARGGDYDALRSLWLRMLAQWGVTIGALNNGLLEHEYYKKSRVKL